MRGDAATRPERPVQLVAVHSLQGVPVFSSEGKKLGVLEGVTVIRPGDTITYAILRHSRFLGLLKSRRLLRRSQLTIDDRRGGFVLGEDRRERPPGTAEEAGACRRLDPARSA